MEPAPASGPGTPGVILIVGDEELLVDRAVTAALPAVGSGPEGRGPAESDPSGAAGVRDVTAAGLMPGELATLVSPSLFGGVAAVIIRDIQDASRESAAELERYAAAPADDTVVVLTHAGGAKGRALLNALADSGARVIRCAKVTRADERADFIRGEFRRLGRKADPGGVRALIEAVGTDLSELAAACAQLAEDVTGLIDARAVARYYRGRAEASGFSIADRAVQGRLADALEQLRWALATGVSPVLISSALAQGVRALGNVGATSRTAASEAVGRQLGLPSWKVDQVRRQLAGWSAAGVAGALRCVAQADAQVKGEGTSAGYALERAVRRIVECRGSAPVSSGSAPRRP